MITSRSLPPTLLPASLILGLLVSLTAGVAGAAVFGIPAGPDPTTSPASGYFLLVGRDVKDQGNDIAASLGDPTMTGCEPPVPVPGELRDPCGQVFYIEVTGGRRLRVDLFDPGLYEPDGAVRVGPQLDLSFDTDGVLGEVHYDLRDPTGAVRASQVFGPDTQGPGGTNAALYNLANLAINPGSIGVWTLHVYMPDTADADEEVNVFGLSIPGYNVYTYYPVVGHASSGGAPPASSLAFSGEQAPLILYPWIDGATEGQLPGQPDDVFYGLAFFNFDLDAAQTADPTDNPAFGEPPPQIVGKTHAGRVSPACDVSQEFCFIPSADTYYVRENRDINISNLDGTDQGIYAFEFTGMDGSWGVLEPQTPVGSPDDFNAFALEIRRFSAPIPSPDNTDFPVPPGTPGEPLRRWYLPADGLLGPAPPLKEWMGIEAIGNDPPQFGVTETYTIQWTIENPTADPLGDVQAAIHVNNATSDITPPLAGTLQATGALQAYVETDPGAGACPNADTGNPDPKRVVICGNLPSGEATQVSFDVDLTASGPGRYYLLGDGDPTAVPPLGIAGGSRPTMADYLTAYQVRETMGPLFAPYVEPVAPTCSASVVYVEPNPICEGESLILEAQDDVRFCNGEVQFRWCAGASCATGVECLPFTTGASMLTLNPGDPCYPAASASPADFTVEVQCTDDPANCNDSDAGQATIHPAVIADAGPASVEICPGESVMLGLDDPGQGLFTGTSEGRDPCTELNYSWSPTSDLVEGDGSCGLCSNGPTCPYPVASPSVDTTYTVTVLDPTTGCSGQDTIDVRISSDPEPPAVGCTLRVSKESATDLRFRWTDVPAPSGDYEVVTLGTIVGAPPCLDLLPQEWPPIPSAMDGGSVVATAPPGRETAVYSGGQAICPRLLVFRVRPTRPCSGQPAAFAPPVCK